MSKTQYRRLPSVKSTKPSLKDSTLISDIENLTKDRILNADDSDVQQLRDL